MTAAPPPAPAWHPAGWALVAAAFLVGFGNYPLQVVGTDLSHLPGDVIDNRINNFVLEHGYRWACGRAGTGFWDAPSFHPAAGATAWSDAHLGMLPLYAAARAAGATPEGAFQWHFLLACALNFAAAAWAARRLGLGPAGAAAAAYVFAFGLPVVGQTQHTQLVPRFLVPPAVVFAWEFLRLPRTWRLAAAAGCAAAQFYLTVYIGYFLALTLAAGLLVSAVRFGRGFAWRELLRPGWRGWAGRAAAVAAAGAVTYALVDRHRQGTQGGAAVADIKAGAPVPASWLTAPKNAYHHPASGRAPLPEFAVPEGEHLMHPGLLPAAAVLVVAAAGFFPAGAGAARRAAVAAAWTTVLLAVLVTRFGDVWLYESVANLPGAGGIRVPGRVCLVLLFPAGLALGHLLDTGVRLARRVGTGPAAAVAVAGLAAVALDQRLVPVGPVREGVWFQFRAPVSDVVARQERIARAVRRHPDPRFVYVFPSAGTGEGDRYALQLEVMRATQDLGLPCVNGWSGYIPPGWNFFANYRELATWLLTANEWPPERLHGLVAVGAPGPPPDEFDTFLRNTFPPHPVD
ncbi:MAG: hypothetical protein C0501_16450 [Isosphaera sp.]|nr:hypothetical protein [Isosphaera sp.]